MRLAVCGVAMARATAARLHVLRRYGPRRALPYIDRACASQPPPIHPHRSGCTTPSLPLACRRRRCARRCWRAAAQQARTSHPGCASSPTNSSPGWVDGHGLCGTHMSGRLAQACLLCALNFPAPAPRITSPPHVNDLEESPQTYTATVTDVCSFHYINCHAPGCCPRR